jgi:type II secretory pathway pseudopilin PulG
MNQRLSKPRGCRGRTRPRRGAFTLVEMLIVIGVIIILLSLLIVGLNLAAKMAQKAHTQSLMTSMAQALVRFKDDIGYYPPVLNADRAMREIPVPGLNLYRTRVQEWYSFTSPAEYLIGYDEGRYDGYGEGPNSPASAGEMPPTGIRHPGPDGVWGAGRPDAILQDRDPVPPASGGTAQVYGPYLELDNERLLGSRLEVQPGQYELRFPGEPGYDEDAPKVIADYWGEPVYYFRRVHLVGALTQSYRPVVAPGEPPAPVPTLSDVFCLRPYEILPGGAANGDLADESDDTTTTVRLESAEFALFSKGPDRVFDAQSRRDPEKADEPNRDNIVEVGP